MNFIEVVNLWTKECNGGTAEIRFVTSQHLVSGTIRIYISVHYRNHIWSTYHFKRRWRWPAKYCIAPSKTYFCGACKGLSNDPSDILHRVSLCNVVTFGSRTKILSRHWFVTFHNRGFPFLLISPVRTTKKNRGWHLQKIRKCCNHQFFCFCNLVRIWDKQNFSYNQKRMEMDWIYLFLIWCPLEIRDWYISAVLHQSSDCVCSFWILQKIPTYIKLNTCHILLAPKIVEWKIKKPKIFFDPPRDFNSGVPPGLKALSERSCKLKSGAFI